MDPAPTMHTTKEVEAVVDTILHGNNNFVSTLDHLPCDLIRSLWIIQMLGLKMDRLQRRLSQTAKVAQHDPTETAKIGRLLLRNSKEAEAESKYALSLLQNHLGILHDDINISHILKSKLPGWTSEAVEQRWKQWGDFKRNFLNERKKVDNENVFTTFQLPNDDSDNDSDSDERNGNGNRSNSSSTTSTSSSAGLKIKLNLKPHSTSNKSNGTKRKAGPLPLSSNSHKKTKIAKPAPAAPASVKQKRATISRKEVTKKPEIIPSDLEEQIEEDTEEHYCFCGGPSFGRMVACENEKCPHQWFHFKCVGLTRNPEGEWFCSQTCKDEYYRTIASKKKNKKKKKRW